MDNPKHIFHTFHRIGRQKSYTSSYKAHLHHLLFLMTPVFDKQGDFDEEKFKFDESTDWFFGTIGDQFQEDEKMHIFNNKQKNKIKIRTTRNPNTEQLLLVMVMMANISAVSIATMDIISIML
jgi:hypothetical protein